MKNMKKNLDPLFLDPRKVGLIKAKNHLTLLSL